MLEEISESIHARRQLKRKINVLREPGVGAEFELNENMADIGKVHIFWEGHTILGNLHQLFDWQYIGQIIGGDFAKFCGLLRIYELY